MVLIAENIHIISKTTKEAIVQRNDEYILNIVKNIKKNNIDVFDLNIGPAKGNVAGSMEYLTDLILKNEKVSISFDTSNFTEILQGFKKASVYGINTENCFLNSICMDEDKMAKGFEIAQEFNPNIIALAFNPKDGIAKTADERLEHCFNIFASAMENDIDSEKIYFDPLVLPVSAAQNQANVVLETIRMLKEGMDNIHTVVGLSNISNGSPKELRPLLNRVFLVLAMGAGLDSAIIDGFDLDTIRIYNLILENNPKNPIDTLYCSLYNAVNCFMPIDEVQFDKNDESQVNIIKAAKILTNEEIYSHSLLTNA